MGIAVATEPEELSSAARIREAALEGFAQRGVQATSIRDVATIAGVSAGLVQHHYASKAALREAVDQHVLGVATESFKDFPELGSGQEVQKVLGDRVTAIVRDRPFVLRYVARSISDSEEAGLALFDGFVTIATGQWRELDAHGLVRADADIVWAGLHTVILNLATAMFEHAIDRHLPEPYRTPEMLERWNEANNELFRRGLYKNEER